MNADAAEIGARLSAAICQSVGGLVGIQEMERPIERALVTNAVQLSRWADAYPSHYESLLVDSEIEVRKASAYPHGKYLRFLIKHNDVLKKIPSWDVQAYVAFVNHIIEEKLSDQEIAEIYREGNHAKKWYRTSVKHSDLGRKAKCRSQNETDVETGNGPNSEGKTEPTVFENKTQKNHGREDGSKLSTVPTQGIQPSPVTTQGTDDSLEPVEDNVSQSKDALVPDLEGQLRAIARILGFNLDLAGALKAKGAAGTDR